MSLLSVAASASAVNVGPRLNQTPAFSAGCEVALVSTLQPVPPSCSLFDPVTAQTPRGQWRVTSATVRTGPRPGPMRFTMIQALRSKSGAGGVICCTASSMGPVFTPRANSSTRVRLNLAAVNTTEVVDREQIEVVDYLGITLLNQAGSIAFASTPVAGTNYFSPAFTPGALRLGGAIPYSVIPMIRAVFQPCGGSGSGASSSAVACAPRRFSVSRRVRRKAGGKLALLTARVPGRGRVIVQQQSRGASLVRRRATVVRRPGTVRPAARLTARGVRILRRRGKVRVAVRVTFRPGAGRPSSRTIVVTFRR
jgi:hypothetical protein